MADDRSLKDLIRFVDPSGNMDDADIAAITKDLKFTEVLDLVDFISKDNLQDARNLLSKYDDRFNVAIEYSQVPKPKSGFKPIQPTPSSPTIAGKPTNPNGQMDSDKDQETTDLINVLNDPLMTNRPEVKQIQNLLLRMKR